MPYLLVQRKPPACAVRVFPLEIHPFKFSRGVSAIILGFLNVSGQQHKLVYPFHEHRGKGQQGADTFGIGDFIGNDHGVFQSVAVAFQFIAVNAQMNGRSADFMRCDKCRDAQHCHMGQAV